MNIEGLEITSRNLAKNMNGCTQVVMLGATLGVKVDMLMKRYSLTEMSRTVVLQACAATMLEEYLNNWQKSLKEEMTSRGYFLRPRFSPGYGDFSILHQKDILECWIGQAHCSICVISSSETLVSAPLIIAVIKSAFSPFQRPASLGPPEQNTVGMFSRIDAMSIPGVTLSQFEIQIMASAL